MTRRALCLSAALYLLSFAGEAAADKSCLSRAEAKAFYNGAYLHWHRGPGGARCWAARRLEPQRRAAPTVPADPAPPRPLPTPLPYPPPSDLAPFPAPPTETRAGLSIYDFPLWLWKPESYGGPIAALVPVFIPPPTPVNRTNKTDKGRATITAHLVIILVAFWLCCFLVGMKLWQRARAYNEWEFSQ